MAVNDRLKRYLDRAHAPYETLPHREAFSARQVAAESHVPERQLAKVLVLAEEGDGHLMVVQAGNHHEVVRMAYPEYARLARPVLGEFSTHEREKSISE